MKLKKILQNINIINIILLAAVIAFAAYSIFPTLEMKVKYALPSAKSVDTLNTGETGEPEIPSLTEYTAVVDENLFHPERRIPPEKKAEQPLPQPDFVLYGTMISDDLSLAYMEDLKAPRNTPGRGKRQVALKKGDSMSGFVLTEIDPDKVTMIRGEEKLIVAMNDPQKPKAREMVATTTTETPQAQAAKAPTPAQRQREPRRTAQARQTQAPVAPRPSVSRPTTSQQGNPAVSPAQSVSPNIKKEAPSNAYMPTGTGGGLLFPRR